MDRYLRFARLDAFDMHDPMAFVPAKLVHEFLDNIGRKELSQSAAQDLEAGFRFQNMKHFGEGVLTAPSMLTAVSRAADPRGTINTQNFVEMEIKGATATITDRYEHTPGRSQRLIETLSLCLMLDGVVQFGGRNCRPLALEVTADHLLTHTIPIDLSDAKISFNRPSNRVTFPAAWLAKSPRNASPATNSPNWAPDEDYSSRLMAFFDGMEPGRRPNLEFTAECSDVSPRSIQRRLQEEGTSFFDLLDQWSFGTALELIGKPNYTISEVSERLGYSYPAHFSRSFQRWAGQSATEYRENLS
ncbi:MAG: helix-turn-helix domain-containing protein [Boseongicola sp.]